MISFICNFSFRFIQLCDPYHSSRFLLLHSVIVWINFWKKMCRSRCLWCIIGTLLLISNNWNWFHVLVLLLVAVASSFWCSLTDVCNVNCCTTNIAYHVSIFRYWECDEAIFFLIYCVKWMANGCECPYYVQCILRYIPFLFKSRRWKKDKSPTTKCLIIVCFATAYFNVILFYSSANQNKELRKRM